MTISQIPNLDRLAAQHAQNIVRRMLEGKTGEERKKAPGSIDNSVTKSLGVLQEDGLYACVLYLFAKEGGNGILVIDEILNLLSALNANWMKPQSNDAGIVLTYISENITNDLDSLLLAKETLEQMLIYARYSAKAQN